MERVIKVLNRMEKEGVIKKYCIGGGMATVFYIEPLLTYDIDIFFIPNEAGEGKKGIMTLNSIYEYLKKKGYKIEKEYILIEGFPVQFIPVYNNLVKEGVENSIEIEFKNVKTRILKLEYLVAIMIQTFRPKDRERLIRILEEGKIDKEYLYGILQKHKLREKFEKFMKNFKEVK